MYSLSGGLALSACMRTIISSAGLPRIPATPPAIEPARAILYAGIGPGPMRQQVHLRGVSFRCLVPSAGSLRHDTGASLSARGRGVLQDVQRHLLTRMDRLLRLVVHRETHHRVRHLSKQRPGQTVEETSDTFNKRSTGDTGHIEWAVTRRKALLGVSVLTIRRDRLLNRIEPALVPARLESDLGEVEWVGDGRGDRRGDTCERNGSGSGEQRRLELQWRECVKSREKAWSA